MDVLARRAGRGLRVATKTGNRQSASSATSRSGGQYYAKLPPDERALRIPMLTSKGLKHATEEPESRADAHVVARRLLGGNMDHLHRSSAAAETR